MHTAIPRKKETDCKTKDEEYRRCPRYSHTAVQSCELCLWNLAMDSRWLMDPLALEIHNFIVGNRSTSARQ